MGDKFGEGGGSRVWEINWGGSRVWEINWEGGAVGCVN